jgi:hypothetical protein
MANKVKLTEADLNRIVRKVMNEAPRLRPPMMNKPAANPKVKALAAYLKQNNVTPQELNAAISINRGVTQQPAKPAQPQQGGNFISNAVNSAKEGIQKTIDTGLNYAAKGLRAASKTPLPRNKNINIPGRAVTGTTPAKPQAQGTSPAPAKPQAQGVSPTPAKPQAQMTPEQLKAIQGQAKRV